MTGPQNDSRYTECPGCGRRLDVTERHVSVERRFEVQDPPGHVVEIGHATGAAYHERCGPSLASLGHESVGDVRRRLMSTIGTFTFRGQPDADFARLVDVVMAAVEPGVAS